jgi:CHASE3 domain sensor protein
MAAHLMLDYFAHLEDHIADELESVIELLSSDVEAKISDVQPTAEVVKLAARAAASVIVAFERGFTMAEEVSDE